MNWRWNLNELKTDTDLTVFSCFSCGGGSSMGYKRAGLNVIGNVELDKAMNEIYVANNHPKHNFCMDLRKFNEMDDLPAELYDLDILDGSPPCSTFSMAGLRERSWGKEKKFREGQKEQRLDDLFFVFLETVEKLRPKVVVAENVRGIIMKNARGYVNEIIKVFKALGYEVQIFLLNSAMMDVPQARERVFFVANRCGYKKLTLDFHEPSINFGKVRTKEGKPINSEKVKRLIRRIRHGETRLADALRRDAGKDSLFSHRTIWDDKVCITITSGGSFIRMADEAFFSDGDFINVQSFPQDYDFKGRSAQYVTGMSVPPNMMAHVAEEIKRQWFG